MTTPAYKRILLKLSGEALMGDDSYGINRHVIERVVSEIADINGLGVEVAVVIGVEIFFEVWFPLPRVWIAQVRTIWGCLLP